MATATTFPTSSNGTYGKLTDAEALEYVSERVHPRLDDSHRLPMERDWMKNILFLNGNQHFIEVGNGFRAPMPHELGPHRVLYRANMLRTLATKMIATIKQRSVTFRAPARDWTKQARDEAFVSEKLFDHLRDNVLKWDVKMEDSLTWAICCGSGFIEFSWDPDAGDPDRFWLDENGSAMAGLTPDQKRLAEEEGRYQDIPPGDVSCRSVSPFQMHWDSSARNDFDECRWAATKELVDIEELEDTYGFEKIKAVRPAEPDSQSLWYDEMLAFQNGIAGYRYSTVGLKAREKEKNRTVLIRYFERPARRNKWRGRYLVTAGGVVLVNKENHMVATHYPLPFIKIDWQRRPGSFIGHAPMEDMRNPQHQYNNVRGRQTEVVNVHGNPPILINKLAELPQGILALDPGVTYQVNMQRTGGKVIELGPVPNMPKEVTESANRAMSEMQMMASQADPDMSAVPGQIRGAPALEMLIAEKNKSLLPAAQSCLMATLLGGRMGLSLLKANQTTARTMAIVGEDNRSRVIAYEAASIITDIKIVGEPEYFSTKASERAKMLEYVQVGALDPANDPEDKIAVLKTLAYGNAEQAIAERLADEENQDREWDEMAKDPMAYLTQNALGEPMLDYPTNPFDNDGTHLRVMVRRMKSEEWRRMNPVARQLLIQHFQEHQEKENQRMARQMAMMQSQQGGPGQKGQPSKAKKGASNAA